MNPVIVRELRARMRGWRAMVTLTLYLAALSGFVLLYYQAVAGQAFRGAVGAAFIGKAVFSAVITVELLVVCLVAPALTAGAIASERERQTLDVLMTTPLPSWSIVWGKLVAALAFLVELVLAAIPLASISFLLGGVAPEDVLLGSALVIVTAFGFGAVGLAASAFARTTWPATIVAYTAVALLVVGTYAGQFLYSNVAGQRPPGWLMQVNPFAATASAIGAAGQGVLTFAPFPLMRPPEERPAQAPAGAARPNPPPTSFVVEAQPLWRNFVWIYLLAAALCTLVAGFATKPAYRWRFWTG